MSRAHVEQITDAATPERAAMLPGVERELVDYARIATPPELRAAVRRVTDAFDGDGGASADEAEHARNRLSLSTVAGRGALSGDLDAESTEIVATALDAELEALAPPDGEPRDRRPIPERRADALVSIAKQYLAGRTDGPGSRRGRTHVSVIADIGALTGITDDLLAKMRAEAAHVGRLSQATLERLTCDCKLARILMDGPSQVLDVGRATRTVTTAQWNALVARDQHCTHPGCTRPPAYCDAHHIIHWTHGGPTNLANLRLLCWEHHRKQHLHDALQQRMIRLYASAVRRFAIWVAAILIALLAGSGFAGLIDARLNGWAILALVVASLTLQAFVAVSIVTALESLFPALRPIPERVQSS